MWQTVFNWTWLTLLLVVTTVRKLHEHRAGQRLRLKGTPLAEVVLMALWAVAAGVLPLFYIFGSWLDFANLPVDVHPLSGIVGAALFSSAIWLLHRSHRDLGKLWSPAVEPLEGSVLITGGVYARVRHPMYTAHLLWGGAQALLLPNVIAGPFALVLLLVLFGLRVPREERALTREFGEQYRDYAARTGRILPRLRRTA